MRKTKNKKKKKEKEKRRLEVFFFFKSKATLIRKGRDKKMAGISSKIRNKKKKLNCFVKKKMLQFSHSVFIRQNSTPPPFTPPKKRKKLTITRKIIKYEIPRIYFFSSIPKFLIM